MSRTPRNTSRIVGLAIGAAAVTLTLLLLVLLTRAQLSAHAGYIGSHDYGGIGTSSLADWRMLTAYQTFRSGAGAAAMAATGNDVGAGLVSGAAKSLANSTTDANRASTPGGDNIALDTALAPNVIILRAVAASRYYRPVAAVMAVFGIFAIVMGCIAARRRSTTRSDDG